MSFPKSDRVLKLLLETQNAILSDILSAKSILRRCLTICQLLNKRDEIKWIRLELNGYGEDGTTLGELEKVVPEYRRVRVLYYSQYGTPILIQDSDLANLLQSYPLGNSISELEDNVEHGLRMYGGHSGLIRKEFDVPAAYCLVSPIFIRRILNSVKNRALEFSNQTIIELGLGNVLSDIFEQTRRSVDKKLVTICPEVLKNLIQTYNNLSTDTGSHHWRKIAFACRDILQDFTETIFDSRYLPAGEPIPRKEQTKNKVRYTLMSKLGSTKGEERKLIEIQLEYFDKLTDYINKHLHRKATKEDAHKCVIYTYLIIGDILELMSTN